MQAPRGNLLRGERERHHARGGVPPKHRRRNTSNDRTGRLSAEHPGAAARAAGGPDDGGVRAHPRRHRRRRDRRHPDPRPGRPRPLQVDGQLGPELPELVARSEGHGGGSTPGSRPVRVAAVRRSCARNTSRLERTGERADDESRGPTTIRSLRHHVAETSGGGTAVRRIDLRRSDGVAMTEFALILPIFMVIVAGLLGFGRVFFYWIQANHVASETARWAVVDLNPYAPTTLQQAAADSSSSEFNSDTTVCIARQGTTLKIGDPLT